MKRFFTLLITCVLVACTNPATIRSLSNSTGKHYQEMQLGRLAEFEGSYHGVDEAMKGNDLLSKHGQKVPMKNIQGESFAAILSALPALCKKYPYGHLCFLFKEGSDEYIAVPTQAPKEGAMSKAQWTLFKNEQAIFSAPMNYSTEGPIVSFTVLEGHPAVTFQRDLRQGVLDDNGPKPGEVTQDTYYQGKMLNETYDLEASHGLFVFKGMIGFVGKREGKEFLFFNGKAVTKPFDAIRTESCCAVPHFPVEVHDNGAVVLVGERGDNAYLTEVDLNEYSQNAGE